MKTGILVLALIAAGGIACSKSPTGAAGTVSGGHTDPDSSPRAGPVTSLDDAKMHAVGIWSFTEPLDSQTVGLISNGTMRKVDGGWEKLAVKSDGTCEAYGAVPIDDNWGAPAYKCKWSPLTGKYSNTGARWYGFALKPLTQDFVLNTTFIFEDDGNVRSTSLIEPRLFKKGDASPFSK